MTVFLLLGSAGCGPSETELSEVCPGPPAIVTVLAESEARAPAVATSPVGAAAVVWESRTGGPIMGTMRTPDGTWSPPQALSTDGARRPQVVMTPTGTAIAAWDGVDDDGQFVTQVSEGEPDSGWTPALGVGRPQGPTPLKTRLVAHEGEIAMGWRSGRGLVVARRRGAGEWGRDRVPGASGVMDYDISIGPNRDVTVAWTSRSGRYRPLFAATRPAPGRAWGNSARLSELRTVASLPRVITRENGSPIVLWRDMRSKSRQQITTRTKASQASGWRPIVRLGPETDTPRGIPRPPGPTTTEPVIVATADGGAIAAWSRMTDGHDQAVAALMSRDGTWTDPVVLSQSDQASWPSIASDQSVVWEDLDRNVFGVRLGRVDTDGVTCCRRLSPTTVAASAPVLAPFVDGRLMVAWQNSSTTGLSVAEVSPCTP